MVIATFFPTNGSIVQHQSYSLGNSLVMKLYPPFGKVLLLVALKFDSALSNNRICVNNEIKLRPMVVNSLKQKVLDTE